MGSFIRQEIGQQLLRGLHDPRLEGAFPSVTRVKVAPDLAVADVYLTFMGSAGKQKAALAAIESAKGKLRSDLGKELHSRVLPQLRFHHDEQLAKELAVLDLIRKNEAERQAAEADAGEPADVAAEPAAGEGGGDA